MIINNKLRTLFVLALYIGFTIAIYYLTIYNVQFSHRTFICFPAAV